MVYYHSHVWDLNWLAIISERLKVCFGAVKGPLHYSYVSLSSRPVA
jgi:hypothetical protein